MRDDLPPDQSETAAPVDQPDDRLAKIEMEVRILATTDVHMQVLGHDYVRDAPLGHRGLAGLASLINTAREEAQANQTACILLDNGDMLQGTALGDSMADMPVTPSHPIVACLDAMAYDAIGVGNHDLDHGLTYLQRIAGVSCAPFVSTNLVFTQDCAIQTSALIEKECYSDGTPIPLTVGVLSVLPLLTGVWNKPMLEGHASVTCGRAVLADVVPVLRAQGADVVILLAHMGIEEGAGPEDARDLANICGVDAVIAGHTHLRLPGEDHAGLHHVDADKGRLGPCPAAMPGFGGSDLAVLDLNLIRDKTGAWQVTDHTAHLRKNTSNVPASPDITVLCMPAHENVRAHLAEAVGKTNKPLHNFFSLAMPTPCTALLAAAKRRVVAEWVAGTSDADLPLLAAAPADTAGGRHGPDHFLNIEAGPVFRRALAGLSPYTNTVTALRVTGADLRRWLEFTVGIYTHLQQGKDTLTLKKPGWPTFHFDTIYGLRYGVDPTQEPGHRITFLTYDDCAVENEQPFLLATNQFRAAGGGGGPQFGPAQILCHTGVSVTEALLCLLKSGTWDDPTEALPWRFDCEAPVQAILRTSPRARDHLDDIAHLSPECLPLDAQGFLPIRLTL